MRILLSWLRDFVPVAEPPEEIGRALSLCGFELAAIEPAPANLIGRQGGSDAGDAVFDFEVTANRPDCLSVLGIARETATRFSLPLRQPAHDGAGPLALKWLDRHQQDPSEFAVHLEDPESCPRYSAAAVDVKVGPSPAWLAGRLQAAGLRPINNVVDVTNYVLIELGQPMHAFDLERLAGSEIRVRRARPGETIQTLDGETRSLQPEMLVIADKQRPQAIAGVMGGALSEVGSRTTMVLLESACFEARSVRRTSRRLGLKSEASARFERGTDIHAPITGIERACALLEEIGAGKVRGSVIDHYPVPADTRQVRLHHDRLSRVLGLTVPADAVARILSGLGFRVVPGGEGWDIAVPTFRVDVAREADLVEEVARHYGYDRLPATFPALDRPAAAADPRIARDGLVRRLLLAAGFSEAMTFSFIDAAAAAPFAAAPERVAIGNPLSAQFAVLRPSLLPGLIAAIGHNRRRERRDVRLFEIGACVTPDGERRRAACAWTGEAVPAHWSGGARNVDFFDVKGVMERLADGLQVELALDGSWPPEYLVRGRSAVLRCGGRSAGVIGLLAPNVVAAADLPKDEEVYVAELDLDLCSAARSMPFRVKPLPRHPSIVRDISIVVDEILPAEAVRGTIRSAAPDILESVREFDRYRGKGVPEGRLSLSLRLTFRSPQRTLTDSEVQTAMEHVIGALAKAHNAVQR